MDSADAVVVGGIDSYDLGVGHVSRGWRVDG